MTTITPHLTPDVIGAAFGIVGTLILALNGPKAGWGFVSYLGSNAAWLTFAWSQGQWPLLVQTAIFTVSSLLGVWVWLIKPLMQAKGGAA